jgi:spore maturation protein CgeB
VRVLFSAMSWDYGFRDRGVSYEYANLYNALTHMHGVEVELFDFLEAHQEGGHDAVRRGLLDAVDRFRPQLLFTILYQDQVPMDVLAELRDRRDILTFNWFCDDHWRFEDFTARYAPLFNACSTTATSALPKYASIGYENVIKTQWACNHHLYRPSGGPPRFDVTFVGQPHGNRRKVISAVRRAGHNVHAWGQGWEEGRLEQDDMIQVFSESRINLNLSNASVRRSRRRFWHSPPRRTEQIKGRNFEIPGCGGFQLSGDADDLRSCFEPDREIVIFRSDGELTDAVGRYLRDDDQRRAVAEAGYRRTIAEHTYAHRFAAIFRELGLSSTSGVA